MRLFLPFATVAGLLLSMGTMPAFCVQNRLMSTISNEGPRVPLRNSVAPGALRATDLGPAPANKALSSLTLRFSMTAAQSAALDRLIADQENPNSPRYRQWLTPETYAAQFGLSQADIARVTEWVQGQGLTVTGVARSHSFITFSGTTAQVEHAFGTTVHLLSANGEQHIGNLSDPVLPPALAGVVNGMTGLNDFRLKSHLRRATLRPEFTSATSGNHFLAPGDFATIYGLTPLLNSSTNGAGVTIAIMGQTDVSLVDVAAFRAASGLPASVPTIRLFGPDPGTVSTDLDEAELDLEWSGAAAPGASLLFVNGVDVIGDSLTNSIDQNIAPILSISYGLCEAGYGDASLAFYNQLLRQGNSQGQTVVAAGGDAGATDCDFQSSSAVNGLAVTFPASSPYVTGIGGTQFNQVGGSYFGTTNDALSGSALSYIPETVWNESAGSVLSAGGGGVSSYFTKPSYQTGVGVPNDLSRDVPDLAFDSAFGALNVPYLYCAKGFCTNGYRDATGTLDTVGGTSVPTPAFAGILALLEQKLQTKSGLGNVNPVLYSLANSSYASSVFHDVTTGNNASPCTVGTADCPSGGSIGYGAGTGYDLASGLGSVNVFNMVSDWGLVTPVVPLGPGGSNGSLTTLVSTPASVPAGTAVSVSATVTIANPSTSVVAAVPTGTMQLLLDNVAVGGAVQLANGSATLPVATTGLGSGAHTIAAVYSGDTFYDSSKGISTIDVVSTALPDFSLTASTGQLTVATGATASGVTFTVNPVNGFTGSVAFSATNLTTLLAATSTFSVNPLTISSSAVGTTVFTLTASIPVVAPTPLKAQGSADLLRWSLAGSGVALAGGLLLFVPRRRRRIGALVCVALATGMIGLSGCSSGSTLTPIPVPVQTFTNATPGTYTVFVSATSTSATGVTVTHRSAINLVVQ